MRLLLIIVLAALITTPARAFDAARTIAVDGLQRTFLVVTPDRLRGKKNLPAVVALHGGTQTGAAMRTQMRLEPVAAREGFLVIYPEGVARGWNDGRADRARQRGAAGQADDVKFLNAVVAQLAQEGLIDARRVFVTGASNGGMMSLRMACDSAGTFAAVAAIIANLPAGFVCKPARAVPMLIINGTADPLVPWEGGGVGFAGRRGDVISTAETVAYWRRVNGCTDVAREAVADRDPHDGSTVTIETGTCVRAPVVLMRVDGGGHRIPGTEERSHPIVDRLLGRQNHDIEAADVVWRFFTGAPLNPK